jgi:hypothetical protein
MRRLVWEEAMLSLHATHQNNWGGCYYVLFRSGCASVGWVEFCYWTIHHNGKSLKRNSPRGLIINARPHSTARGAPL